MKTTITVNLDTEIRERLEEIENKSALVNDLLARHFELLQPSKVNEKAIIDETKAKIEAEAKELTEHEAKMLEYEKKKAKWAELKKNPKIMEKYQKGYKEGKWKSNWEFMEKEKL